jgi:hypothetical protein
VDGIQQQIVICLRYFRLVSHNGHVPVISESQLITVFSDELRYAFRRSGDSFCETEGGDIQILSTGFQLGNV